jgi:hypothetical protein
MPNSLMVLYRYFRRPLSTMGHAQQTIQHKSPEDGYLHSERPKKIISYKLHLLSFMCLSDCDILDSITIKMKGEECRLTLHITSPSSFPATLFYFLFLGCLFEQRFLMGPLYMPRLIEEMNVERWSNDNSRRIPKRSSENLSQCHFVHCKPHKVSHESWIGPRSREDWLPWAMAWLFYPLSCKHFSQYRLSDTSNYTIRSKKKPS